MGDNLKSCGFCSNDTRTKSCGNCLKVSYCSVDCQKKDLKRHKYDCFPMEREPYVYSRLYQVDYFATRDIKQGETVFKETALCVGPAHPTSPLPTKSSSKPVEPLVVCLGCCIIMKGSKRCSDCFWPLCGPKCMKLDAHKSAECKLLSAGKMGPPPRSSTVKPRIRYDVIRCLRAILLRSQDPIRWEQFMKLFPYCDIRNKAVDYLDNVDRQIVFAFVQTVCKNMDFDEDTINKVITIDNYFGAINIGSRAEVDSPSMHYIGRFVDTIRHSCIPNLRLTGSMMVSSKNAKSSGTVVAIALVDIKKGDKLTISAIQDLANDTTLERRKRLSTFCDVSCQCPRCTDPTELGTYYSAIKCQKCQTGYLLPDDPLVSTSRWLCSDCSSDLTYEEVERIFEIANSETSTLMVKAHSVTETKDPCRFLHQLEQRVKKNEKMHPNFFGNFKVKFEILSGLYSWEVATAASNDQVGQDKLRKLNEMDVMAQYCYAIVEPLFPGLSYTRAHHLYFVTMSKWLKLQEVVRSGCMNASETELLANEAMDRRRELRNLCSYANLEDTADKQLWMIDQMDQIMMNVKDYAACNRNPIISERIRSILN